MILTRKKFLAAFLAMVLALALMQGVAFGTRTYRIAVVCGANGTISPSSADAVAHGGSISFTIAPNAGYDILDVLVDGESIGSKTLYTFTNVTADHAIEAAFVKKSVPSTSGAALPAVAPDWTPPGQSGTFIGGKTVSVYENADSKSAVIGKASSGEPVSLLRWRGSWCYVLYSNATKAGWVQGKYITGK